ncbi:MAG: pyridoxal-phosphate dependent enzyme [Acidimicrobiales bacterium]
MPDASGGADPAALAGADPVALGGPHPSWLTTPPGARWPDAADDEPNPYVRWRSLLWSHHRALAAGWTDDDVVALIRRIDAEVAAVDGTGFHITPTAAATALVGPDTPRRIVAKDETGNVGGSHKARHLMGLLLHLAVDAVADDTRLAISSCGNAALGAATVARAAGRPIDVFIPTWADRVVVDSLQQLEATVHVCERRDGELGDPCMARFQEAVADGALPFGVQATENRWTLDGGRTIGWELAAALAGLDAGPVDHVLVQVGGGALLTSCAIGLLEAADAGVLERSPRVWAVQAEHCAPFDRAWRGALGLDSRTATPAAAPGGRHDAASTDALLAAAAARAGELMVPWPDPSSAATGILDDVTYDWLGMARGLLLTGGGSIVAAETDIEAAHGRAVAAGFGADATGTAGIAGVLAGVRVGALPADEAVAVLVTGRDRHR